MLSEKEKQKIEEAENYRQKLILNKKIDELIPQEIDRLTIKARLNSPSVVRYFDESFRYNKTTNRFEIERERPKYYLDNNVLKTVNFDSVDETEFTSFLKRIIRDVVSEMGIKAYKAEIEYQEKSEKDVRRDSVNTARFACAVWVIGAIITLALIIFT